MNRLLLIEYEPARFCKLDLELLKKIEIELFSDNTLIATYCYNSGKNIKNVNISTTDRQVIDEFIKNIYRSMEKTSSNVCDGGIYKITLSPNNKPKMSIKSGEIYGTKYLYPLYQYLNSILANL